MSSGSKLLMIFDNVNMGRSHDGLTEIAKRWKVDPHQLQAGELLLFINRARDKIKVFAPNNVIAYYRAPKGTRVDMQALQYIPRAFTKSGKIDYDEALKKVLQEKLVAGAKRSMSPLEAHRALVA